MIKEILIVSLIALSGLSYLNSDRELTLNDRFQNWKQQFNKRYSPIEELHRFENYKLNLERIREVNSQNLSYFLKETQFMDLTRDEFQNLYLQTLDTAEPREFNEDITLPAPVDHSEKMGKVKNQGNCGSCWSFSAAGAMEGFFNVKQNLNVVISEQQLVSCDKSSFGCSGGFATYGIDFYNTNGALLESEFPYKQSEVKCTKPKGSLKANGRKLLQDVDEIFNALSQYPLSVSVDATNWDLYGGGIFNNCNNVHTNHGVVAVGFDADGNIKIRNSWGTVWGEKGHIRLQRGNTCSVYMIVSQVI